MNPSAFGSTTGNKLQLKERLSHSKALSKCIVGIETSDKLTDPQIVAKVKDTTGSIADKQ